MSEPELIGKSLEFRETRSFTPTQELKMNIFSQGIRPTDKARASIQGSEGRLTTGDYVSTDGVILKVDGLTTINAPFPDNNPFAKNTPNVLDVVEGKLWIISGDGKHIEVEHVPIPAYLDKNNPQGTRYGDMIVTHTDRARMSPIQGCALDCQFCNIPAEFKYRKMAVQELVDSVKVAIEDSVNPAQHLLISGGTPGPRDFNYLNDVYEAVAKTYPGLEIDIMMTPSHSRDGRELLDPRRLKDLGIHALSVNLELNDDNELAQAIMRGKANIGRDTYLRFLERAVEIFGVGNVRSILMVGIEPIEETLIAVEELAKRGICPELSPFRPDPATPLKDMLPPSVEDQKRIYLATQETISRYKSQYPGLNDGLQCIDCMHNVLVFPGKESYRPHYDPKTQTTTYEYPLMNS